MNATGSIVTIPDSDDSFKTITESPDGSRTKIFSKLRRDEMCAIYVQHHWGSNGNNLTSDDEAHKAQKSYGKAIREIDPNVENATPTLIFGKEPENTSTDKKSFKRQSSDANPVYISSESSKNFDSVSKRMKSTVSEPVANLKIELDQNQNEEDPPKILLRGISHFDSLEVSNISSVLKPLSALHHQEPNTSQLTADDSPLTSNLITEQPSTSRSVQPIASTEVEPSKPTTLKRKCDDDYLSCANQKQIKSDSGVLSSSSTYSNSSSCKKETNNLAGHVSSKDVLENSATKDIPKESSQKCSKRLSSSSRHSQTSSSRRDSVKPSSSPQHHSKDSSRNDQKDSTKPSSSNDPDRSSHLPRNFDQLSSSQHRSKDSYRNDQNDSSKRSSSRDSSSKNLKNSSKQNSAKVLSKNESEECLYRTVLKNALARHSTSLSIDSLGLTPPKAMDNKVNSGVANSLKDVNLFGPMTADKHSESSLKKCNKKQNSKKSSSEFVHKNVSTSKSKAASIDVINNNKHKSKSNNMNSKPIASSSKSANTKSSNRFQIQSHELDTSATATIEKKETSVPPTETKIDWQSQTVDETKAVKVEVSVDEIEATVKVGVTVETQTDDEQLDIRQTIVKCDASCQVTSELRGLCEQTNIQTSQNDVSCEAMFPDPIIEELRRTIIELRHTIAGLNTSQKVVTGILNDYVTDCTTNHVMKGQKTSLQKQTISDDQFSLVTSSRAETSKNHLTNLNLPSTSVARTESGSSSSTTSSPVVVNSVAQNSIAPKSSVSSELTSMGSVATIAKTHPVNQRYRNSITAVTTSQANSPISSSTTPTAAVISLNSVSRAVPVQQQLSLDRPESSQILITTPYMHWTVPLVLNHTQNSNTLPLTAPAATTSYPLLGNAFSVIPTSTTTSTFSAPIITPHMLIPRQPQRTTLVVGRNTCTETEPSRKPTLQMNTYQQSLQRTQPMQPSAIDPSWFQNHSSQQCVLLMSGPQIQRATNTMPKTTTQGSQQLYYQQCQTSQAPRCTITRSQSTFMTKQQFQKNKQQKQLLQNIGSTNISVQQSAPQSVPQSVQQSVQQALQQISNAQNQKCIFVVHKMPVTLGQSQQLKEQQLKEQLRQEQLRQEELRQEQLRQEQLRQEQLRQEQLRQEQLHQEQQRQEEQGQEEERRERLKEQTIIDELKRDNERLQNEKLYAMRQEQQSSRNRNLKLYAEPDFWCVQCSSPATLICTTCFGFSSCSSFCWDILQEKHGETCSSPNLVYTSDLRKVQQR